MIRYDDDVEEFGHGLPVTMKRDLIGISFVISSVSFHQGDYGAYAAVFAVNADDYLIKFHDGSSGVYRQIVRILHERGLLKIERPDTGEHEVRVRCPRGLRVSEYESPAGKPSLTYYLA